MSIDWKAKHELTLQTQASSRFLSSQTHYPYQKLARFRKLHEVKMQTKRRWQYRNVSIAASRKPKLAKNHNTYDLDR